jgi:N-acetylmuramoyl-L-alanine amidase
MYKNKMLLIIVQASKSINRLHRLTPGSEAKRGISDVKFITAIGLCLIICAPIPYAYAQRQLFKAQMPVVAIDPGHGGKDTGAKSPNGSLEKTVTLNLALMIAQQLDSDYRVVLTRNDDYALENSDRTAVANHAQADIFISLHTGSSFIQASNRSAVYFYKPFQGSALRTESAIPQPSVNGEPADRWNTIQTKYQAASEKLANQMQAGLTSIWQPREVSVQGIPMLVLEGADMPAVAIEIGNLANASSEKQLIDSRNLLKIARAIARAITAFLAEKPQ